MTLGKLKLINFRNFNESLFEFSPKISLIIGPNATGKTNILESIHLLSTGKSFKAGKNEEMINYDAQIARSKAKINDTLLEAVLTRGTLGNHLPVSNQKQVPKKRLLLNNIPKRQIDFAASLKAVVFRPQDLDLITLTPTTRRKFLDSVLSLSDYEYRRAATAYEKGLRRRNRVLFKIREEGMPRTQLAFWDQLIIKNGDFISQKREDLIDFINQTPQLESKTFSVKYDKSAISEERLKKYERAEVASATTLVGPHRDDIIFNLEDKPLSSFGSRGEQRMAVLWTKLAELAFIKKSTNENPLLLLDDVLSELDDSHKKIVTDISRSQQTILTSADTHLAKQFKNAHIISLK